MTMTMAIPAAAASGSADCPGLDIKDPLSGVKCTVDGVTGKILPSPSVTSAPTTSPAPDRTSAPVAEQSGGDTPAQPARRTVRRPAHPASAPADSTIRRGTGHGASATWFAPPLPASVRLPPVEPSDPYPQVAGDPAYDGRPPVRAVAAAGTDARSLWARIATALVLAVCALHLHVITRLLRRHEAGRPSIGS